METLGKSIGIGNQYVIYDELILLNESGLKIKVTIKSDAYQQQSYANADVWSESDLKWNKVFSIHYSNMSTPEGLVYKQTYNLDRFFTKDKDTLLSKAKKILS